MEAFNKSVTGAATKLSKEATMFVEKHDLEKKVEEVKKSAEEFAKEHDLDIKAMEAKDKAEEFSKEHELGKKFEDAKGSAEIFVKEHELDVKMNDAKISAEGFAKEHNLDVKYEGTKKQVEETVSDLKSGVDAGISIAEDEKILKDKEEKSDNTKGSNSNIEEQQTTKTKKENYPGDVTLEVLKKEINAIAEKIEVETKNLTEREDVQKVLTPLMAKLTIAKAKFIAMTQKNNDKGEGEDVLGVEIELGKEDEAEVVVENNDNSTSKAEKEKPRKSKLPSEFAEEDMMNRAKKAVKNALENAETVIKKAATKFGINIFDNNENATESKIEEKDDKAVVESL